jgi:fructosamine-3-kinase
MNVQEEILAERIDPFLTDERLSALAGRALGETAPVHGFEVLTGGCWNRVIGVRAAGADLVLKISPNDEDVRITREYRVLETFDRETALPVPQPLLLDEADGLLPGTALVMTRLPGRVMLESFGFLDRRSGSRIIDEIAEHVTALHETRGRGFGGVELAEAERHRSWPDFWLPRFDRVIEEAEASGKVPTSITEGAREVRPYLADHLEIGEVSTMTHYDIWAGNVMIDVGARPPRVSGFIDIPGFYADYARELSFAMLFGVADERFLETYARRHEIDEGFALRTHIYNLKMNIKHVEMYPLQPVYSSGAATDLDAIRAAL